MKTKISILSALKKHRQPTTERAKAPFFSCSQPAEGSLLFAVPDIMAYGMASLRADAIDIPVKE